MGNNNEIRIKYKINKNIIKLFDSKFIENNKNKCKFIYEKRNMNYKNILILKIKRMNI